MLDSRIPKVLSPPSSSLSVTTPVPPSALFSSDAVPSSSTSHRHDLSDYVRVRVWFHLPLNASLPRPSPRLHLLSLGLFLFFFFCQRTRGIAKIIGIILNFVKAIAPLQRPSPQMPRHAGMVPAHRRRREPQLSNQQGVRDVRFQRRAYRSNTACRHEEHYRQEAHRAHGFEVAIDH